MDKPLSRRLASHVELAVLTPDVIDAWNTVVSSRHLCAILSYKTKTPTLFISVPGSKPEPCLLVDTPRHKVLEAPQVDEQLNLAREDMQNRIRKLGLRITLKYKVDKQKRKSVILAVDSLTGGPMFTALHIVNKGEQAEYSDFKLADRWF